MQTDNSLLIIDSAIDWLTITARRGDVADSLHARAHELLHQSMSAGNYLSRFTFKGYKGEKAGEVSYGRRYDGSLLTLTSREAARSAMSLLGEEYHVTRIDVQVTCADDSINKTRAEDNYYALQVGSKRTGRPLSTELRLNSGGGKTLYMGSKHSDVIARLYDKGVESKAAQAGECWRYEVQHRRRPANFIAAQLRESKAAHDCIATIVTAYFSDRGLLVPQTERDWASLELQLKDKLDNSHISDQDRQLRWLAANVSKTVARLLKSGKRIEVLRALGLSDEE